MKPRLPERILGRRKMGFSVPLDEWFRTSLKPTFESLVMRPEMDAYLNRTEVARLWQEHQSRFKNHRQKLWNLLMFACWESRHYQGWSEPLSTGAASR